MSRKNQSLKMDEKYLQELVEEVSKILSKYGYNQTNVKAKDLINYFSIDTQTGDTTTLSDIVVHKLLLLHEIVELNELKRNEIPISEEIFHQHNNEVLKAHVTATEWEFLISKEMDNQNWINKRLSLVEMWIKESNFSPTLEERLRKIILKYSN